MVGVLVFIHDEFSQSLPNVGVQCTTKVLLIWGWGEVVRSPPDQVVKFVEDYIQVLVGVGLRCESLHVQSQSRSSFSRREGVDPYRLETILYVSARASI